MFFEDLEAVHHQIEAALSRPGDAIGVMQRTRAIDAQAHQKMVRLQESAPFIVQGHAIGLEGLRDDLVRLPVFFHQRHGLAKKLDAHQCGLAALPGDRHFRQAMRFKQLPDIGLECGIRHPVLFIRIQGFLGQEEAVLAVDVASGPTRF